MSFSTRIIHVVYNNMDLNMDLCCVDNSNVLEYVCFLFFLELRVRMARIS